MSGIDTERAESIAHETLLKSVKSFVSKYRERPDHVMRVVALLITYYEVPNKTFQDLLAKLGPDSHYGQAL